MEPKLLNTNNSSNNLPNGKKWSTKRNMIVYQSFELNIIATKVTDYRLNITFKCHFIRFSWNDYELLFKFINYSHLQNRKSKKYISGQ